MLKKNEIPYLSCCLCGMSKAGKIVPRNFKVDPLKWMIVEIRQNRGGRGVGGFFLTNGYTVQEALESKEPEVRELAELQLSKLKRVVKDYLSVGILKLEDFEKGS
jgi:hypothetical protein